MFAVLDTKWGEPTLGEPSGTITWSNELGGDLVLSQGTTDADIDAALAAAFDRWENVAAIDFEQVDSGGDVVVSAASLNEDRMDGDPFVAGVATWEPDFPRHLNEVTAGTVEFADELLWSPDGTDGTNFFAIALHEIGHIIGLDHPGDASQIMNSTIFVDDLGAGDIEGAQYLYGRDAGDEMVDVGEPVDPVQPVNPMSDADDADGSSSAGIVLGLLLGLVALIAGIFTGGAGAVVAMAAGRVTDNEGAEDADDSAGHAHDHLHLNEDGTVSHAVYIADTFLADMPTVNVGQIANPCGCVGMCDHIVNDGSDEVDDLFV